MSALFDLTGRVAVVTGGNGGLGLGMAEAMAQAGCAISIWGRNAEKNRDAVARLEALGAPASSQICNVADAGSVAECFAATLKTFGRVDGMFANAGVPGKTMRSFVDRPADEWTELFATNVDGVAHCYREAAKHMVERAKAGDRFGRLVATTSVAALEGAIYNEHYGASKGAHQRIDRTL